ncbi:thiolase family protein [Novosphingobium pokkalii]|uniref:thiolase family protein n=1 Tax=Novosphingobium pokkalii TaxID=1770194 RepID=UPI003644D09E
MEDYLSARMISTPFGLYDCDVPCDGAVAVIVSAADAARDTRKRPVRIEAVGTRLVEPWSWNNGGLDQLVLARGAAQSLWKRTDLKPADVDVAELYDGFTFNCLSWLELLGFCPIGEGGRFVEGGSRIALDGELPLNTHGGQLSAGRLQGYTFLHEACVQLRGEGGNRQVESAEVAIVSTGAARPAARSSSRATSPVFTATGAAAKCGGRRTILDKPSISTAFCRISETRAHRRNVPKTIDVLGGPTIRRVPLFRRKMP